MDGFTGAHHDTRLRLKVTRVQDLDLDAVITGRIAEVLTLFGEVEDSTFKKKLHPRTAFFEIVPHVEGDDVRERIQMALNEMLREAWNVEFY